MISMPFQFAMPTEYVVDTREFPLGVTFVGATDDGVNVTVYYIQRDQSETLAKNRTLEFIPPYFPVNDDGRTLIDMLSNGYVVMENTENTLPDQMVRNA